MELKFRTDELHFECCTPDVQCTNSVDHTGSGPGLLIIYTWGSELATLIRRITSPRADCPVSRRGSTAVAIPQR